MAEQFDKVIEIDNFIFLREWLDSISDLDIDIQDKIIGEIVRYGTNANMAHEDNQMVAMAVNFTKNGINRAKRDYYEKIKNGSKGGRQKVVDDKAINELAKQGKRSEDIAKELGISKSSVDHSQGWKMRNDKEFKF